MKLVNMKSTPPKSPDKATLVSGGDQPEYPYGLRIRLESEDLKKLGITTLPPVGTTLSLDATVEVCSTGKYESTKGEPQQSLELQVTDMALAPASDEEAEPKAAEKLYGGKSKKETATA